MAKTSISLRLPVVPVILFVLGLASVAALGRPDRVEVGRRDRLVSIENDRVRVEFDLGLGLYRAIDKVDDVCCIEGARFRLDDHASSDEGVTFTVDHETVRDELGSGMKLMITNEKPGRPRGILEIAIYEDRDFIVLGAGLENTGDRPVRLKRIDPLAGARAFPGSTCRGIQPARRSRGGKASVVTHGPFPARA